MKSVKGQEEIKPRLRILHLEDDLNDVELVEATLAEEGITCDVTRVQSRSDFTKALGETAYDIILADFKLPSFDGLSALSIARKVVPEVPFIFISGAMGEELAIETLKNGATDYVLKHRLTRLVPAVRRALREAEEHAERRKAEEELKGYHAHLEELVRGRTAELGIANDQLRQEISERRLAEEKLQRTADELARSNADLQHFAYAVSHDLQEPLRAIGGFIKLLEKRYRDKLDSKAQEFICFTLDGVRRMQHLIEDLLEYSKVGTKNLNLGPADFSSVVEESISNLRASIEETGASVTYDRLPVLMADSIQIARLFQNLIGNAIKFHGDKPVKVHVSSVIKEGEWVFSVCDNGVGMDPKNRDKIFEVFQRLHSRREYSGTGIGLAICKRIVERHGGGIWVDSEPGKGSTFYFTIAEKPVPV